MAATVPVAREPGAGWAHDVRVLFATVPPELLAARSQMAFTLGFHIVLACLGVGLPTFVLIANAIGLRRRDPAALLLARRWSTVMAVTFAVGAVTGTVLSFEMGLLWPVLMGRFGGAFGIPFAVEGLFFFLEAIFIAIYIYGWRRLSPRAHFLSGIPVALAGLGGTFSVVAANAWMNQPAGYVLGPDGRVAAVAPLEVIFNRATVYEVPHMLLAAYMVTGFLLASCTRWACSGGTGSLRPARLPHPVRPRGRRCAAPGRGRRRRGARDPRGPAGQVRGDGADHDDGPASAGDDRRDPRRRTGRRRPADPGGRLAPGRVQPGHRHHRARRDPGRPAAAGQHRPPGLGRDGRDRDRAGRPGPVGARPAGGGAGTTRPRAGSCGRRRWPVSGRSSPSRRAGS